MDLSDYQGNLIYGGKIGSSSFLALKNELNTYEPDSVMWMMTYPYQSGSYRQHFDSCKFTPEIVPYWGTKLVVAH